MTYRIMISAPSAGGKSTLMRYLRDNTGLLVAETDEEVMKANDGKWPEDSYKNDVLIPKTTNEIISRSEVVYLMKDILKDLLIKARAKGFKVIVLQLTLEQLEERDIKRVAEEGYESASEWFKGQLDYLDSLKRDKLIDDSIDGNLPTAQIAKEIKDLAESQYKR